jgi:hypothetical protein
MVNVRVRSATYNPSFNAITILFAHSRTGKALRLVVTGLAGADGLPVSAFAITI